MKKQNRLRLERETIRQLAASHLQAAAGGLSGRRCSAGKTGCGECTGGGSLGNSACAACATEVDCVTGGGCLTFEPGCGGGGTAA
jgi:hypothetical protein